MEISPLSRVIRHEDMLKIRSEFSRLGDRCYLENAGASLYPKTLLKSIHEDMIKNVYMNPHTDKYTRDCIEQIRCLVLRHFNADPTQYSVIFTSGTTQSLKLAVESFQFASNQNEAHNCGIFMYLRDNHTSVLGLREIATDKNADVLSINHEDFLELLSEIDSPVTEWKEKYENKGNTLLVYPAQSNFNGFKYPLNVINNIKKGVLNNYVKKNLCKINCNWYVLLDAASYVATNNLDLRKVQADFVCMSFYKIFGYPTGLGALLVKNSSANILSQKRYYGGGTVDVVLSSEKYHVKRQNLHERFEDGTVPFLSVIALKHCFDTIHSLIPKSISSNVMDTISHHTFYLAQDLYNQLNKLEHPNEVKAAVIYSDTDFTDVHQQGAIVTFNIIRSDNSYVGYAEFQHLADLFNINIRTGCFCNSGSCQRHLHATNQDMKDMYKAGHRCGDDFDLINGEPTGAVRASFGYYNTFDDVDKLVQMIYKCFIQQSKFIQPKRLTYLHPEKVANNTFSTKEPLKKTSHNNLLNGSKPLKLTNTSQIKKAYPQTPITKEPLLTEMAIFPIKSCGAFKIRFGWKIGPKGFEYDREWMIVKDNGVCLTQKQVPLMCKIKPTIDLNKKILVLQFEDKSPMVVPLEHRGLNDCKSASFCHTKVCTDIVNGMDCGDEVADWISEALEISYLRLIRQSDSDKRTQKKKKEDGNKLLSLSNQAQFLLINKATVRWLNDQIRDDTFTDNLEKLTDRFRGNLIIDMDQPLVERQWDKIIIGKHEFMVEGMCQRCQMVCIDQDTGEKTVEPLRTISEQFEGKLRFGIYLHYIGPVDGSRDRYLKNFTKIKPLNSDGDISRFKDWLYTYFLSSFCCTFRKDRKNRKEPKKKK